MTPTDNDAQNAPVGDRRRAFSSLSATWSLFPEKTKQKHSLAKYQALPWYLRPFVPDPDTTTSLEGRFRRHKFEPRFAAAQALASCLEFRLEEDLGESWEVSPLFLQQLSSVKPGQLLLKTPVPLEHHNDIVKLLAAARRFGFCREAEYPRHLAPRLGSDEPVTPPAQAVLDSARQHELQGYEMVEVGGRRRANAVGHCTDGTLEQIKEAISKGHPVLASFDVGGLIWDQPSGKADHGMIITGHRNGQVQIRNSWAPAWQIVPGLGFMRTRFYDDEQAKKYLGAAAIIQKVGKVKKVQGDGDNAESSHRSNDGTRLALAGWRKGLTAGVVITAVAASYIHVAQRRQAAVSVDTIAFATAVQFGMVAAHVLQ